MTYLGCLVDMHIFIINQKYEKREHLYKVLETFTVIEMDQALLPSWEISCLKTTSESTVQKNQPRSLSAGQ